MLVRNAAWNYAGTLADVAAGALLLAVVTRHVDRAEFAVLVLVLSLVELLLILDGGVLGVLTPSSVMVLRERGARGLAEFAGAVLGVGLVAAAALALGAGGLVALVLELWPFATYTGPVLLPVLALVVFSPAAFTAAIAGRVLEARQAYPDIGRARSATALLRLVLATAAVLLGWGILGLIAAYAAAAWFRALVLVFLLQRSLAAPLRLAPGRWREVRALWPASRHAALDGLARHAAFGVDALVLAAFAPFAGIALLGVAQKIPHMLWNGIERSAAVTLAPLTEHHGAGRSDMVRQLYATTCRSLFGIALPLVILLGVAAPALLGAWAGAPYAAAAATMRWLLLSVLVLSLSVPSITLLYAMGRIRLSARLALIEGAANLLLSALLAPRYGPAGVAFATALTHTVGTVLFLIPAVCAAIDLPGRALAARVAADVAVPLAALTLVLALAVIPSGEPSVALGLLGLVVAGVAYAALWYARVGVRLPGQRAGAHTLAHE